MAKLDYRSPSIIQSVKHLGATHSKILSCTAISVLLCAIHPLTSAGTSVTGHVKSMQISKPLGTMVFIELDSPQSSPIACHINTGWTYTIPQQSDTDKKFFALLTMAKATGQKVILFGSGACSDFSAVESASTIHIE